MAIRRKIEPKLLLIINKKSHIGFQITCKLSTLDDIEDQYCNRNCIDCRVSSRARRFYCEKYLQNLLRVFSLFVYSLAIYITWRDDHVRCVTLAFIVAFETR